MFNFYEEFSELLLCFSMSIYWIMHINGKFQCVFGAQLFAYKNRNINHIWMVFLQYEQEYVFEFLQASSLFLDKLDRPIAYVQLWLDSEIAKKRYLNEICYIENICQNLFISNINNMFWFPSRLMVIANMILQMIFSFARKVTKVTWKGLVFTMNKNMSLNVWSSSHNNRTKRATKFSFFYHNWLHLQLDRTLTDSMLSKFKPSIFHPNSRNENEHSDNSLFWN